MTEKQSKCVVKWSVLDEVKNTNPMVILLFIVVLGDLFSSIEITTKEFIPSSIDIVPTANISAVPENAIPTAAITALSPPAAAASGTTIGTTTTAAELAAKLAAVKVPETPTLIDDEANGERPLLVLHVGPPKTGTTSLQDTLAEKDSRAFLQSDGYMYIGDSTKDKTTLISELTNFLQNNTNGNQTNIIGSREGLYNAKYSKIADWADAVDHNNWDVKIIVSYRRLHELLPSCYNQKYKFFRLGKQKKNGHRNWPGIDGDYDIPTFAEYLDDYSHGNLLSEAKDDFTIPMFVHSYQRWDEIFPNSVRVFHFHQEGDPTINFVCQEIPGANEMCRYLLERKDPVELNPTVAGYIDCDMLAVKAYNLGTVHDSDNRFELAKDMCKHHDKHSNGANYMPMICPDEEAFDAIYDASETWEEWALPYASKPVTDFDASWNKTMAENKFCNVNAEAALEEEFWIDFLYGRYQELREAS